MAKFGYNLSKTEMEEKERLMREKRRNNRDDDSGDPPINMKRKKHKTLPNLTHTSTEEQTENYYETRIQKTKEEEEKSRENIRNTAEHIKALDRPTQEKQNVSETKPTVSLASCVVERNPNSLQNKIKDVQDRANKSRPLPTQEPEKQKQDDEPQFG